MTKEAALRTVRRKGQARRRALEEFVEAMRAAQEAGASWAEIATAAGAKSAASVFRLVQRHSSD